MVRKAAVRAKGALIDALGETLSAVSARDARGYFEHAGYRLQANYCETREAAVEEAWLFSKNGQWGHAKPGLAPLRWFFLECDEVASRAFQLRKHGLSACLVEHALA
jgi:hypothetical protein